MQTGAPKGKRSKRKRHAAPKCGFASVSRGSTRLRNPPIKPPSKHKGQVKDTKKLKCKMCEDTFPNYTYLLEHMRNIHLGIQMKQSVTCIKYRCKVCAQPFSNNKDFKQHSLFHAVKEKPCSTNNMKLRSNEYVSEVGTAVNQNYDNTETLSIKGSQQTNATHLAAGMNKDVIPSNVHTGDIFCQCPDCVKDFKTVKGYREVGGTRKSKPNIKSTKNRLICETCNESFTTIVNLRKHKESVHKGIKEICTLCNRAFNINYFYIHMKNQHSPKERARSHKCSKCDKSFLHGYTLKTHMLKTHNNAVKILTLSVSCELCGKMYSCRKNLNRHKVNNHTIHEEEFVCAHCNLKFVSKPSIRSHMKNVHLPPTYRCKMCDLLFNTTGPLKRHLLVQHSVGKVQSFVCETCGKAFTYKKRLEYHMTTSHSGDDKQFKCPHCGKSFFTQTHLQQHSIVHSDDRNFNCGLCDKGFKLKHHLKQHMAVHGLASTPDYRRKKLNN